MLAPLTPPNGAIEPASAARASVVGRPSASKAQLSGIAAPSAAFAASATRVTTVLDWSTTSGLAPASVVAERGTAKASGLVPKTLVRPPQAVMLGGALVAASATRP